MSQQTKKACRKSEISSCEQNPGYLSEQDTVAARKPEQGASASSQVKAPHPPSPEEPVHAVPERPRPSEPRPPISEMPPRPPEPPEPKACPPLKPSEKERNITNDWVLILGLHRGFTQSDLKKRWSELIKLLHPDKSPAEAVEQAGGAERCRKAHDELTKAHEHAKTFLAQGHTGSVPPWGTPPSYPWLRQGRRPKPAPPTEPWPGPDPAMPLRLDPDAVTIIETDLSQYLRSRTKR